MRLTTQQAYELLAKYGSYITDFCGYSLDNRVRVQLESKKETMEAIMSLTVLTQP